MSLVAAILFLFFSFGVFCQDVSDANDGNFTFIWGIQKLYALDCLRSSDGDPPCPDRSIDTAHIDTDVVQCNLLGDLTNYENVSGKYGSSFYIKKCYDCTLKWYQDQGAIRWSQLALPMSFWTGYLYTCASGEWKICTSDCNFNLLQPQKQRYRSMFNQAGVDSASDLLFNPNDNSQTSYCDSDLFSKESVEKCSKCLLEKNEVKINEIFRNLSDFCVLDLKAAGKYKVQSSPSDSTSSSSSTVTRRKIAIGVGVSVGTISLVGIILGLVLFYRRIRRNEAPPSKTDVTPNSAFTELPHDNQKTPTAGYYNDRNKTINHRTELQASSIGETPNSTPPELPAETRRAELA